MADCSDIQFRAYAVTHGPRAATEPSVPMAAHHCAPRARLPATRSSDGSTTHAHGLGRRLGSSSWVTDRTLSQSLPYRGSGGGAEALSSAAAPWRHPAEGLAQRRS